MSDRIILGPDGRKYITNEPLLHEDKQAAELRRLHAENEALREANEAFGRRQEWWNEKMVALEERNAELAGLIQQIIDSRDEHFIDNCVDGMWGWDERANAALAKVEASNGS